MMIDNDRAVDTPSPDLTKSAGNQGSSRAETRKENEQKRRILEGQYFDEVMALLAMSGERIISKKMDKTTALKETARFIRFYDDLTIPGRQQDGSSKQFTCLQNGGLTHLLMDVMDAFLMIVSDSGRIFYCTELVTSLLGHMQSRLVGQNIFDYILEQEVPLLKDLFIPQSGHPCMELPNCPLICYPCREFQCNLKMYNGETGLSHQYLLFQCLSYLRVWKKSTSSDPPCSPGEADTNNSRNSGIQSCILLIAKLPASLSVVDLPISTNEVNFQFDMRVSREGKIIDIEKQATLVLGYLPSELIGVSFFDCIEPHLVTSVGESIMGILAKGLATTVPYRILSKGGRYLWVISKGTVSYIPWSGKPDHILLSNRVLNYSQILPENRIYHFSRGVISQEEALCESALQSESEVPLGSVSPSEQPLTTTQDDIQCELERKNQELFNLQRRLLEQQQLMEKERNQFYQITRQVMQCIMYPQSGTSAVPDAGHQLLQQHSTSGIQTTPSVTRFEQPSKTVTSVIPSAQLEQPRGYGWP